MQIFRFKFKFRLVLVYVTKVNYYTAIYVRQVLKNFQVYYFK